MRSLPFFLFLALTSLAPSASSAQEVTVVDLEIVGGINPLSSGIGARFVSMNIAAEAVDRYMKLTGTMSTDDNLSLPIFGSCFFTTDSALLCSLTAGLYSSNFRLNLDTFSGTLNMTTADTTYQDSATIRLAY